MKNKIGRYIGQRMMWISLICIAPAFPVRAEQAPEAMIRETGVSYETVEEALEDAQAAQTVVLTEDAQISGQVRVREGVTLVLPAEGEGYVGQYNPSNQESTSTPVLEHTLTIPSDASLEVDGTLLVNAVTGLPNESATSGAEISGAYSRILLDGTITVNEGGLLDVYGYLTGGGTVIANSGSQLRDLMTVKNWRGIDYAKMAYFWNIFPFNEYDMHHIQAKTVIYSGASLGGNVRLYADGRYYSTVFLAVDNQNGIFRLDQGGRLEKSFEEEREVWRFYGGASFANAQYKIQGNTLNTASCFYSIDGDQDFELYGGSYRMQNAFKWMPGGTLTVGDDAVLEVTQGGKLAVYDSAFQDAYTKNQTAYPARKAALLTIKGALAVNGQIGGSVVTEAGSQVSFGSGARKYLTVKEGSDTSSMGKDFTFYLNMSGAHRCRYPDSIAFNYNTAELGIEKSLSLSVSFLPSDTTERALSYTSSQPGVATVDSYGNVKGVAVGSAVITAISANGRTATCKVNVIQEAPASVKASVLSNYRVKVTWSKAAGAKTYTIYRSNSKNGTYRKLGKSSGSSYTDKKAVFGKQYYYKVAAGTAYSKAVSVKVQPLAPKKVKASAAKGKVKLSWKKNGKVDGYQIYRATSKKGKYKKIGETKKLSFEDQKVKTKKYYYYRIRSYRKAGKKVIYGKYSKICKIKSK